MTLHRLLPVLAIVAMATPAAADVNHTDWLDRAFGTSRAASKGGNSGSLWSAGGGQTGVASYYWQPQRVASGGTFNPNAMTAAHKSLPFGTRVRVTHLGSGRSVDVVINDRGPFVKGRIIDLSKRAAQSLGIAGSGLASVRVEVL